ncbi:MAG: DUF4337 domain-containing protein [Candidatus Polarisedimenticolia bacterium]|nr:DUF4337 domain-containing protein [bacterium]
MSETPKERWMQWVAVSTTILAVAAGIGALKGGAYSTRVQLATTKQVNKWSYYEAKSIKLHVSEAERSLLAATCAAGPCAENSAAAKRIASLEPEIARYNREMTEIKADAEALDKDSELNKRHAGALGQAVMFLQLAIMLSAMAALLKKRPLWWIGLAVGAVGLVYFSDGFFLWF